MKNIKLYNFVCLIACFTLLFNCSVDDNVVNHAETTSADLGSLLNINGSGTNRILGAPIDATDIPNSAVGFQEFEVVIDVEAEFQDLPVSVSEYMLYLQKNDGEKVLVETNNTLPFQVTFDSIEDFLSTGGWAEESIRIGDQFTFTMEMLQSNGDVYRSQSSYTLTVNCSSALAGDYTVVTTRDDGSSVDFGTQEIVEVSPGYYQAQTAGLWAAGSLLPDQSYYFNDTCGTITVPEQNLFDYYSNLVYSESDGIVAADGTITIVYTIEFSSGNSVYTSVYTPIN